MPDYILRSIKMLVMMYICYFLIHTTLKSGFKKLGIDLSVEKFKEIKGIVYSIVAILTLYVYALYLVLFP